MFLFGLAERLGMTVSELLDRLDMSELAEWMAFLRLRADPRAFNSVDDNLREIFGSLKRGNR